MSTLFDRIKRRECEVCGKIIPEGGSHAYYCGYYCSEKCYDTLFEICQECGNRNMTAKTNRIHNGEQLCDQCYNKKHGLGIMIITCGR